MRSKLIYLIFLICTICMQSGSSANNVPLRYRHFDNLLGKTRTLPVRCMTQDEFGIMWIGTSHGLYSFDGYVLRFHNHTNEITGIVYCMLMNRGTLYLGCENGLFMLNPVTSQIKALQFKQLDDVYAMDLYRGWLLLGANSGLFTYSFDTGVIKPADFFGNDVLGRILTLKVMDENVYIGTMDAIGRYNIKTKTYHKINCEHSIVVGALALDQSGEVMWVGTGVALMKLDLQTDKIKTVVNLPVVKVIKQDSEGRLLLGTDNGLYIRSRDGIMSYVTHDARYDASLTGESVWDITLDSDGNWWFGTDNGISVSPDNGIVKSYFLSSITGTNSGNQLSSILCDTDGTIWLAGNRGILRLTGIDGENLEYRWYHMNSRDSYIPHNRVRRIYKDISGEVWLATDLGLLYYNAGEGKFKSILLNDESYWIYSMARDSLERMWVATFSGLHCIVSDLKETEDVIEPIKSYTMANGLSSDKVQDVSFDGKGNLWVLANGVVNLIDTVTDKVTIVELPGQGKMKLISKMQSDKEGNLWVATDSRLFRLTAVADQIVMSEITLPLPSPTEVLAMIEVEDELWLTMPETLAIIKKDDMTLRSYMTDQWITALFYDPLYGRIWMGSTDKFMELDHETGLVLSNHPIKITDVCVNNKEFLNYTNLQSGKIVLPHSRNSLQVSFTDLKYAGSDFSNLMFKLDDGTTNHWMALKHHQNSIFLPNLPTGNHRLYIASSNCLETAEPLLTITIQPQWYFSAWAICLYLLLTLSVIVWGVNHIRIRRKLADERRLRQMQTEQGEAKMQFLINVAREFKSPLSLILSILGQLRSRISAPKERELLDMANAHTLKLSSLLQLSLATYRDNNAINGPIPTKVDFIELIHGVIENCMEEFREQAHTFTINVEKDAIFIYADAFKIETILTNLFSKICRCTISGTSIEISIVTNDDLSALCMKIIIRGIYFVTPNPGNHLRHYDQSGHTVLFDFEGDDIEMLTVKDFVNMHKGTIEVAADATGTVFTLILPILTSEEKTATDDESQGNPVSTPSEQIISGKPIVAIVESNLTTANYIADLLRSNYHCVMAHNGKTGLALCIRTLPDIVVTAYSMPVMDGLKMCREMKRHKKLSTTPIIMLTDRIDNHIELESIKLNVDAFIATPINYSLLQAKIVQLLSNRIRLEEQIRLETIHVPSDGQEFTSDEKFLKEIIHYIESDITNPDISVNWLSSKTGISEKQLYRHIKRLTNLSTSEYIRDIRLEKSASLLRHGQLSVSEAMYMSGFSHASYFSRCFKKKYGVSPKEYTSSKQR
nr:two-component regulator propeller domain-containing protein [Bacteroides intestinalis]